MNKQQVYLVALFWWHVEQHMAFIFQYPPCRKDLEDHILTEWRKKPESHQAIEIPLLLSTVPDHAWVGEVKSIYGKVTCEARTMILNDGGIGEVKVIRRTDSLIGDLKCRNEQTASS